MAEITTIARPYAEAAFRLARDEQAFDKWSQMLRLLETFRTEQRTILLTTHQRELAEPLADFVLTLEAGAVASLEEGPYAKSGAMHLAPVGAAQ